MAQILVRGLDDDIVVKLKRQAKSHGRSLQAEVRTILGQVAEHPKVDMATARKMLEEFRKRFRDRRFADSAKLIRGDRDR